MSYSEVFIATAVSPAVSMSDYYTFDFFSRCAQRTDFSDKLKEVFFFKTCIAF